MRTPDDPLIRYAIETASNAVEAAVTAVIERLMAGRVLSGDEVAMAVGVGLFHTAYTLLKVRFGPKAAARVLGHWLAKSQDGTQAEGTQAVSTALAEFAARGGKLDG